jgi:hypothetical protein
MQRYYFPQHTQGTVLYIQSCLGNTVTIRPHPRGIGFWVTPKTTTAEIFMLMAL